LRNKKSIDDIVISADKPACADICPDVEIRSIKGSLDKLNVDSCTYFLLI